MAIIRGATPSMPVSDKASFVEGNKLTVKFDKAGEKRVIDQFVARA